MNHVVSAAAKHIGTGKVMIIKYQSNLKIAMVKVASLSSCSQNMCFQRLSQCCLPTLLPGNVTELLALVYRLETCKEYKQFECSAADLSHFLIPVA